MFTTYGAFSGAILIFGSLPLSYIPKNLAAVLALTNQLDKHTNRILQETAKFVISMMAPGGIVNENAPASDQNQPNYWLKNKGHGI